MKRLLISIVILLYSSTFAQAKDFSWQGAQVQTAVGGTFDLIEDTLSIHSCGTFFFVPGGGNYMYFAFTGIKWQVVDWFWFMPLVGYAGNWTSDAEVQDPQEAADIALRVGFSFFDGQFEIFLEGEPIFNKDIVDYYGFYSIDYIPAEWFKAGVHAEQINKGVMFGPHIGFSKAPWGIEIQYYAGVQDANYGHAVRFFNKVIF